MGVVSIECDRRSPLPPHPKTNLPLVCCIGSPKQCLRCKIMCVLRASAPFIASALSFRKIQFPDLFRALCRENERTESIHTLMAFETQQKIRLKTETANWDVRRRKTRYVHIPIVNVWQ